MPSRSKSPSARRPLPTCIYGLMVEKNVSSFLSTHLMNIMGNLFPLFHQERFCSTICKEDGRRMLRNISPSALLSETLTTTQQGKG